MIPNDANPFTMMVLPPWFGGDHHAARDYRVPAEVPPRVQVAMAFLRDLTAKTAPLVTKTDMGALDSVDGQKLVHEETQAQAAALALLTRYFGGTLRPSRWDKALPVAEDGTDQLATLKTVCVDCKQMPMLMPRCKTCGGQGYLRLAQVKP